MSKRRGGRGSKYTDEFKRRLVVESHGDGVSVPMVSRRHGVPTNRIFAWRGDARFHGAQRLRRDLGIVEDAAFIERHALEACHDCAPFMLDGEVRGQNHETDARPAGDPLVSVEGQVLDQRHAVGGGRGW